MASSGMVHVNSYLSFDLPEGYRIEQRPDKKGGKKVEILCGSVAGRRGGQEPDMTFDIHASPCAVDNTEIRNLPGNIAAYLKIGTAKPLGPVGIAVMLVCAMLIQKEVSCTILGVKMCRSRELPDVAERTAEYLHTILNSMVLGGVRGDFEPITGKQLLEDFAIPADASPDA